MNVHRMAEGVVLAAAMLLAAAMAVVVAKGVPLTNKDLESEASMWSLYQRWRSVHTVSLDLAEKERRFETFKANARYINEFNKRTDVPYKLGLNQFSDLTLEEFTSTYTGALPEDADAKDDDPSLASAVTSSDEQLLVTAGDVPDVWDWRDHGAVAAVKNQGNCNSCWAFSMVGSVEGIYEIKSGDLLTLSEQEVLDCCGYGNCKGGSTWNAFLHAIDHGLAVDNYGNPPYYPPYAAEEEECRFDPKKLPVVKIDSRKLMSNTNEAALKFRVYKQPVSVLIDANSTGFQNYKEGVFTGPCGTKLNHAMLVVGYGTTADRTNYWIVKNSWGSTWGEQGYIRMKRDMAGVCAMYNSPMYPIMI